jgi:hypothetical protein
MLWFAVLSRCSLHPSFGPTRLGIFVACCGGALVQLVVTVWLRFPIVLGCAWPNAPFAWGEAWCLAPGVGSIAACAMQGCELYNTRDKDH